MGDEGVQSRKERAGPDDGAETSTPLDGISNPQQVGWRFVFLKHIHFRLLRVYVVHHAITH